MSSTRCSHDARTNHDLPIMNHIVEGRTDRRNYEMHRQRRAAPRLRL